MKKTYLINVVGGPGCGKSTFVALLFAFMKMSGKNIEFVQEYAKGLVWAKKWDLLNNQHLVSYSQYEMFKSLDGVVDFIITDGSLLHGLHYNQANEDNISNVDKTEKAITKFYNEFHNINLFLERQDFDYEEAGRIQTKDEAIEIDNELLKIMDDMNLDYSNVSGKIEDLHSVISLISDIVLNDTVEDDFQVAA